MSMLLFLTKRLLQSWSIPLLLLLASPLAQAEFILFPSITATENQGLDPHPAVEHPAHVAQHSELQTELDLFYSADKNRLRILAEVLTKPGSTSIERFQLGWFVTPQTTLWLGRHHSPLGYWNTQFHHGTYLQTSIKRPAISGFDDHGGVLPSHISGLFAESEQSLENDASLSYAFSLGAATRLKSNGKLAATGAKICIDDFGAAHMSLTFLSKLPLYEIMIDSAVINDLDNTHSLAIVRGTIAFAQRMGFAVGAKGVEHRLVAENLKLLGCDHGQGYYFSHPLPADGMTQLLSKPCRPASN